MKIYLNVHSYNYKSIGKKLFIELECDSLLGNNNNYVYLPEKELDRELDKLDYISEFRLSFPFSKMEVIDDKLFVTKTKSTKYVIEIETRF